MKKKILIIGISVAFMLVTISYATALRTTEVEKKESPLFRLRAQKAIKEKINTILESIKTKFIGERVFWIHFRIFRIDNGNTPPSINSLGGKACTCYDTCSMVNTECGRTCSWKICDK